MGKMNHISLICLERVKAMIQWLFTVRKSVRSSGFRQDIAVCAEPALIVKLKNYYGEDRIRVVKSLLKGRVL